MSDNKYFKYTVWILLSVLIIFYFRQLSFIIQFIRIILRVIVLPTIVASLFYYILRPLVRFLVKRKMNKTFSVIGVLFLVLVLMAIISVFAGRAISNEFSRFNETLSTYFQDFPQNAKKLLDQNDFWFISYEDIESNLLDSSGMAIDTIRENISNWITNITDAGTIIILIPIIVFFLLRDDRLLYTHIIKITPTKFENSVADLIKEIDGVLQNYFVGQLIVALFLGILTYIGYLIIGLPNALFLAAFSMIFSIIPFLGPFIGILPAIFIGWTVNPFMVVKVLIVLIITQQLEGNVIRPKIMGNRLEIHPMVIIFIVVIAVTLFGFIGAFFAIPFYAMVRIIVKHSIGMIQE